MSMSNGCMKNRALCIMLSAITRLCKDEEKENKAYLLHLPAVESKGSTRYDKGTYRRGIPCVCILHGDHIRLHS